MRIFRIAAFCVSGAIWAQVAPIPPSTGDSAIEGIAVDSVTGEPVRKAIVSLTGTVGRTVTSGADGRFVFEQLPEGTYGISVTRVAGMPGLESEPLQVAKAARVTGVVVKMASPGALSGRVLDEDGDPMMGVQVTLLGADYSRGQLQLVGRNAATTDDRGEYRIHSVMPGRYRIQADASTRPTARLMIAQQAVSGQAASELYATTFHPNTRDVSAAAIVKLASGAEIRADFRLEKQRAMTISGRLIGLPGTPRGISVDPIPRDAMTAFTGVRSQTRWNEDGTFTITGVPPGRYWLVTSLPPRPNEAAMAALTAVDTTRGPVSGAMLVLTTGIEISGTVRIESGDLDMYRQQKLHVILTPAGITARGPAPAPAPVDAEGRFRISNVLPGRWDIRAYPRLDSYIESIKMGELDLLRNGMEIGMGTRVVGEVEIVLGTKVAQIEGKVTGSKPGAHIQVVALADGKDRWIPEFMQMGVPLIDGHYRMRPLRPGRYRLYAIASNAIVAGWSNPEVLDALESKSAGVTVEEGGRVIQDLTLITSEDVAKALLGNL